MSIRATVVCCYNNAEQFAAFKQSLEQQSEVCKLIAIDNTKNRYSSCSAAFNAVIGKIETEYVIFSHQDILFDDVTMVKKFLDYAEGLQDGDLLGVAGGKRGCAYAMSNVRHSTDMVQAGGYRVTGMEACDVLDECFFGGKTSCFRKRPFDEVLCDNWHLYAVERCLYALTHGNKVYVCDIPLIHRSKGKINHAYNVNFYNISKVYAKEIDYIRTTCAYASTKPLKREWALLKREISIRLGRYS